MVVSFPHSPLAKLLFPVVDSNLLKFLYDDNQKVEPEWYIPIIPLVLVNGAEGIGTGWACKIPNYDPREIVNNINRMLNHQDPLPMVKRPNIQCMTKKTNILTSASWLQLIKYVNKWKNSLGSYEWVLRLARFATIHKNTADATAYIQLGLLYP